MPDFTLLSKEQEAKLAAYKGIKLTVEDGKGNIVEKKDTRTLNGHYLLCRKTLKQIYSNKYLDHYPQYKIDKARSASLPDKKEEKEILDFDKKTIAQYNEIKEKLKAAKNVAELDAIDLK